MGKSNNYSDKSTIGEIKKCDRGASQVLLKHGRI